jgi:hypothetical protein
MRHNNLNHTLVEFGAFEARVILVTFPRQPPNLLVDGVFQGGFKIHAERSRKCVTKLLWGGRRFVECLLRADADCCATGMRIEGEKTATYLKLALHE